MEARGPRRRKAGDAKRKSDTGGGGELSQGCFEGRGDPKENIQADPVSPLLHSPNIVTFAVGQFAETLLGQPEFVAANADRGTKTAALGL